MTKEEIYGGAVGSASTITGMAIDLIDFKGIFNAILIAAIGAFVGSVVSYLTKMVMQKWFKK